MTMRFFNPLLLAGACLLSTPAAAETLDQAIALALAKSPVVTAARAREDAAQSGVSAARAERMPSLTAQGQIGVGRIDPQNFFNLPADNVSPRSAQATVEMPLFTGGRIGAGINQAKGGAAAAAQQRRMTELDLRVKVASAYSDALAGAQMVVAYGKLAGELDEVVRQAQLKFKAGEGSSTELAQAQARRAEAQAGLAGARGQLAQAQAALTSLVGRPVTLSSDLPVLPDVPPTSDDAVALATQNNPQLLAAGQMVAAARAKRSGTRAESFPTVGAYAEASSVRDQFFPGYKADAASVGVRARWTLFAGGRVAARQHAADAELQAARADADSARLGAEQQAISAFAGLQSARAMLDASQARVAATQEALRGTRLEVKAGAKPQLALLDAEREAIQADAALIGARGQLLVAAYALRAAAGMD